MSDNQIGKSKLTNAIGLGLIVVGVLLFGLQRLEGVTAEHLWPFFVIVPGAALFIASLSTDVGGRHMVGLGAAVTCVGLLLLYQNTFQHFESWAYGWALVFPGSTGVGWMISGAKMEDDELVQKGRRYVIAGLGIFAVGLIVFEFVVGISGNALFAGLRESLIWPIIFIAGGIGLVLLNQRE